MRYLALALALCFVTAPMEAAPRSAVTHKVKVKKAKKAPKARRAKKQARHAA